MTNIFQEDLLVVSPWLAVEIGLNEAIFLHRLHSLRNWGAGYADAEGLDLLLYLHFKAFSNTLNRFITELLTNKTVTILVVQTNWEALHLSWILVTNLHTYLSTCKFLTKDCSLF